MFCTGTIAAATLLVYAAPTLLVGDSLFVPSDDVPARGRAEFAAARGEGESVGLWLTNDEAPHVLTSWEISWERDFEADAVAYLAPTAHSDPPTAVLEPFHPIALRPHAQYRLFIRLLVPRESTAGRYGGRIEIQFEDGETCGSAINLDIFDFSIPARRSLPVLLGLDRAAFQRDCGMTESLADWQAVYQLLASIPAGFQVWPRERAGGVLYDYSDLDLVKAHLEFAAGLPEVPALEFGGDAGEILREWPAPVLESPQDPLQYLLFSLMAGLESYGWTKPAVLAPTALPGRESWQDVRTAAARVSRADGRVTRLLAAPAHPFFERYTDIWALPPSTPRFVLTTLREGRSLVFYDPPTLTQCTATAEGMDASGIYQTAARDAFDGCEATAWRGSSPAGGGTVALEATFEDMIQIESITIIWQEEAPGELPGIETAYHPDSFSVATVDWDTRYGEAEGGSNASMGELKYPRECRSLRLTFSGDTAVAEVLINRRPRATQYRSVAPVPPWLDLRSSGVSLPAGLTAGLRALPWFCWRAGFQGILGPTLAPGEDGAAAMLLGCGPVGSVGPTESLFHLADGLEDVEYLVRYADQVQRGKVEPPADFTPAHILAPVALDRRQKFDGGLEIIREQRLRIGKLLSGHREVTRNFGPRR